MCRASCDARLAEGSSTRSSSSFGVFGLFRSGKRKVKPVSETGLLTRAVPVLDRYLSIRSYTPLLEYMLARVCAKWRATRPLLTRCSARSGPVC